MYSPRSTVTLGGTAFNLPALAVTLALGTAGGLLATLLHLPIALLLGSLTAVATTALFGWRILGQPVHMPQPMRMGFVPIIGVSIGGAFSPAIFENAADWLPSLIALAVFIPFAHFIGYRIYRAGGVTPVTAYYGAVPGGLIESVTMGEAAGADTALLALIQFLRLILTIVAVPIFFVLMTGHQVGSGAGVQMIGADHALSAPDIAVLVAAGVIGFFGGRALRLPAYVMTGPLAASAIAHLAGWTEAVPPGWTIGATQVIVGTGLGARFAGMAAATLRRGFGLAFLATGSNLLLAGAFAFALYRLIEMPISAVFLAFAPGGITEMSLIALSLHVSVVYVTLHHVLRIVLSVSIARAFAGRIAKP